MATDHMRRSSRLKKDRICNKEVAVRQLDSIENKLAQMLRAIKDPLTMDDSLRDPDCFTMVTQSIILGRTPRVYHDTHGSNKQIKGTDRIVFMSWSGKNRVEHAILTDASGQIKVDDYIVLGNRYGYDTSELKGQTYSAWGAKPAPGMKNPVTLRVIYSAPVALIKLQATEIALVLKERAMDKFPLSVKTLTAEQVAKKHGVPLSQIQEQLVRGIKVEREHTTDDATAKEIALDHLSEYPDYYDRLKQVESSMQRLIPIVSRLSAETAAPKKPGEVWKSKSGKYAAKNKKGVTKYFGENKKAANNWAKGTDTAPKGKGKLSKLKLKGKGKLPQGKLGKRINKDKTEVKPKGKGKAPRGLLGDRMNKFGPRGLGKKNAISTEDRRELEEHDRQMREDMKKGPPPAGGKLSVRSPKHPNNQGESTPILPEKFEHPKAQKFFDANKKFIQSLPVALQGRYHDLIGNHGNTFDAQSVKHLKGAMANHAKIASIIQSKPELKDAFDAAGQTYVKSQDLFKKSRETDDENESKELFHQGMMLSHQYERETKQAVRDAYDAHRADDTPQGKR